MIYLDNAGTTKMFDECVEVHKVFSCENFYNPSAMSNRSMLVLKEIKEVEKLFLEKLGAKEGNVIFTGCATESNNLAVKGAVRSGNWEYVFSSGEHASVFQIAKKLEQDGCVVHFVPLTKQGSVDLSKMQKVLNDKTRLISVIHVSNETGAVNDLKELSKLKNKKCPKALLHVDGVQAFMKIPVDLKQTAVDLYSFSAHKIHGPKGIAGLYIKNKNVLKELFHGGGQQYGVRSGTENVSGIMQFKKAVQMIDLNKNFERTVRLSEKFNDAVRVEGIEILKFGEQNDFLTDVVRSPYIENLIFSGVKGETMLHALEEKGVIVGLGSACSSKKAGNRILESIGFEKDIVISSVRVSFNAYMSYEEVIKGANIIKEVYLDIKKRVE